MKKRPSPTRAPLDSPLHDLRLGPPDPWPKPPSQEAGSTAWAKWLSKFLRQFIREWMRFEITWERCSGGWDTGDAPDHLTLEPPGLFSDAAWAMVQFGDAWFSSSEKKPGPVEEYFRRIRDHIYEGTYYAILVCILRRCLRDIEKAVARHEAQIVGSEQPTTADDPPADPESSTQNAGRNGQTTDMVGAGVDAAASENAEDDGMVAPLEDAEFVRKHATDPFWQARLTDIPAIDLNEPDSSLWKSQVPTSEHLGVRLAALQGRRRPERCRIAFSDGSAGIDSENCRFRRDPNADTVWYLIASLGSKKRG